MKQTVKKLLFMLGIMCLTIFGKETSTTVLCRLPRLLTQQGLTTIERVDDAG